MLTFFLHGDAHHWRHLLSTFAEFQILICDDPDKLVALGHIVPLVWDGSVEDLPVKIDDIIIRALGSRGDQLQPNTVSALAAIVTAKYQGRGLGAALVREMKEVALQPLVIDRASDIGVYEDPSVCMRLQLLRGEYDIFVMNASLYNCEQALLGM